MRKLRYWFRRTRRRLLASLVDWECAADLMWDVDNPEQPVGDPAEWFFDNIGGDQPAQVTMQRAVSLPNRTYEVTPVQNEDGDFATVRVRRVK